MTTKVQGDMYDIDGATVATVAAADKINFLDVTDSLVKEDTVQGVLDLAGGLTVSAEQSTSSGTSVTFGSIPAGTTLIFVNFEDVSLDSTAAVEVTIGDSAGMELTGYDSNSQNMDNVTTNGPQARTDSFVITTQNAAEAISGQMVLVLKDSANFTWTSSHSTTGAGNVMMHGGGRKSLSAELTQVGVNSGANNFDGGSISISYM